MIVKANAIAVRTLFVYRSTIIASLPIRPTDPSAQPRPPSTIADFRSRQPSPARSNAIARVITERTRDAFGQSVNPHLFRHCAATTIAIFEPGRIGYARDLLW